MASDMNKIDKKWPFGWNIMPADSVDRRAVDSHAEAHPERWQAAFEFLKDRNLPALPVGNYPILGNEVYASVSEYVPKEAENCLFEAHRQYVDIQYVIEGQELMGRASVEGLRETTPYTPDIAFYENEAHGAVYEKATPQNFFVFFPADAHRPAMRVSDCMNVKKVVIKLLF